MKFKLIVDADTLEDVSVLSWETIEADHNRGPSPNAMKKYLLKTIEQIEEAEADYRKGIPWPGSIDRFRRRALKAIHDLYKKTA
jgi:hypothetical protein